MTKILFIPSIEGLNENALDLLGLFLKQGNKIVFFDSPTRYATGFFDNPEEVLNLFKDGNIIDGSMISMCVPHEYTEGKETEDLVFPAEIVHSETNNPYNLSPRYLNGIPNPIKISLRENTFDEHILRVLLYFKENGLIFNSSDLFMMWKEHAEYPFATKQGCKSYFEQFLQFPGNMSIFYNDKDFSKKLIEAKEFLTSPSNTRVVMNLPQSTSIKLALPSNSEVLFSDLYGTLCNNPVAENSSQIDVNINKLILKEFVEKNNILVLISSATHGSMPKVTKSVVDNLLRDINPEFHKNIMLLMGDCYLSFYNNSQKTDSSIFFTRGSLDTKGDKVRQILNLLRENNCVPSYIYGVGDNALDDGTMLIEISRLGGGIGIIAPNEVDSREIFNMFAKPRRTCIEEPGDRNPYFSFLDYDEYLSEYYKRPYESFEDFYKKLMSISNPPKDLRKKGKEQ